ncbi:MAG: D-alanyl-D-alanine carboxypeptidase/D-alanyl-D-alanine-endopeptidase [Pseudolysinimonas sp.]
MTDEQPPSRRAARDAGAGKAAKPARPPRESRAPRVPRQARPETVAAPLLDENGKPIAPKGGILAAIRKHPRAWILSAASVGFVLLGTGAVFAGIAFGSTGAPADTPQQSVVASRPQPSAAPTSAVLRTCSVSAFAQDPRLMQLVGAVRLQDSGDLLFDYKGITPARTGSVLKVLTASAAILQLTADFQITTSVTAGSQPGTVVLVGRGDATLSAMPPGTESVYAGAPKLSTLASAVIASYTAQYPGQQITSLVLDATYWNPADKWDPVWKRSEQTIGYHSEVTALQVDGDRADPTKQTSPRSTDPIGRAGAAFLQALRDADSGNVVADDVAISSGANVSGSTVLGEVKSQPLRVLIKQMLLNSDNTLAEMLARIVSKEGGLGGSAASLQQAIPSLLWPEQPDVVRQVTIKDGSGLSDNNGVPPTIMSDFMRRVAAGSENLDIVRDALPVAGKSGTLSSRFTGDNAVARGHVTAKTGWIDTAYTLSGFMDAADGTRLTFAFYAVGEGIKDNAKEALDTLTTAVYNCGNNLATF